MRDRLEIEKIDYLYSSVPLILLVQFVSLLLFGLIMWQTVDGSTLATWSAINTVVLLFRFYHYLLYANASDEERETDAIIWLHRYYTYILIGGGIWGSTAILFFPDSDLLYQMVIVLFILGINATAIGIISASWYLVIAYALLSFTPLILRLSWLQDPLYETLAYIVSALGILMIFTAKHFGGVIDIAIRTKLDLARTTSDLYSLKDQFFALLDNAPIGIFYYNQEMRITDVNNRMLRILDLDTKEELLDFNLNQVSDKRIEPALNAVLEKRQGIYEGTFFSMFANKSLYIELLTIPLIDENGAFSGAVGIFKDLTAEMAAKEAIRENAFYDPLTKLPNRVLFSDRLSLAIEQSRRHGFKCAVLFLDLDHFKNINDQLGHYVGDQLLYKVSQRLLERVRTEDTVARIGGDEFLILLNALPDDMAEARKITGQIADELIAAVREEHFVEEHEIHISVSIGAYLFPSRKDDTPDSIMKRADVAMYQAKRTGRNHTELYQESFENDQQENLTMEIALRRALERHEFVLYFQPKVSLKNESVEQVEALIRWQDPEKGLIMPDDFIPYAEQNGLILKIGEWVFEHSVRQVKAWQENERTSAIKSVAVNISTHQFIQPDFVDYIKSVITSNGISPSMIELELTESVMLENSARAIEKIKALEAFGVKIALDDFGTGYSSLSYLKQLPVSVIKIDQSFITDIKHSPNAQMIVKTIILIAKSLGLTVVAEGVESQEEFELLRDLDCDYYQGFFYEKAIPANDLENLMGRQQEKAVAALPKKSHAAPIALPDTQSR